MEYANTAISGLIHFTAPVHRDAGGFFSCGLHVRLGYGDGKLVRCSHRAIDVVVDLRPTSPTYRHAQPLSELSDRLREVEAAP
jgi:dTDP-4-dehydrorhamnose 3,5-epimerase-like enzyme